MPKTNTPVRTVHPNEEDLADYAGGGQPLELQLEIEDHLADCSRCLTLTRQYREQAVLLGTMTAQNHARALAHSMAAVIETALAAAPETKGNERWKDRLTAWKTESLSRVQGLVQVIVESGQQMVRADWGATPFLAAGGWQFQPAARARAASNEVHVTAQPGLRVRVERDPRKERSVVQITVPAALVSGDVPLALLIPLEQPERAQAIALERRAAEFVGAAELGDETGRWLVAIEPLERARP